MTRTLQLQLLRTTCTLYMHIFLWVMVVVVVNEANVRSTFSTRTFIFTCSKWRFIICRSIRVLRGVFICYPTNQIDKNIHHINSIFLSLFRRGRSERENTRKLTISYCFDHITNPSPLSLPPFIPIFFLCHLVRPGKVKSRTFPNYCIIFSVCERISHHLLHYVCHIIDIMTLRNCNATQRIP